MFAAIRSAADGFLPQGGVGGGGDRRSGSSIAACSPARGLLVAEFCQASGWLASLNMPCGDHQMWRRSTQAGAARPTYVRRISRGPSGDRLTGNPILFPVLVLRRKLRWRGEGKSPASDVVSSWPAPVEKLFLRRSSRWDAALPRQEGFLDPIRRCR